MATNIFSTSQPGSASKELPLTFTTDTAAMVKEVRQWLDPLRRPASTGWTFSLTSCFGSCQNSEKVNRLVKMARSILQLDFYRETQKTLNSSHSCSRCSHLEKVQEHELYIQLLPAGCDTLKPLNIRTLLIAQYSLCTSALTTVFMSQSIYIVVSF